MGSPIFHTCVGKLYSNKHTPFFAMPTIGVCITFNVASWTFGFLWPILFLSDLIASLGGILLDLTISEISKLRAISSKLEDVARSICSSRAELEPNQLAILLDSGWSDGEKMEAI